MSAIVAAGFDKLGRPGSRLRTSGKTLYSFRDDATKASAL